MYQSNAKSAEILIVIEGEVVIVEGDSTLVLNKGEAVFLMAESEYQITTSSAAVIYKATAP
ncbi:MAG: hypothetical protein COB81_09620 [Flavobacteriaceae bacterium]|nr:MAG: hypothetical protein COB81_09620 [Flavobacteriaceae bacterium]